MNGPSIAGFCIIGIFGMLLSIVGLSYKNWEFYLLLVMVISYGIARWLEGIKYANYTKGEQNE